MKTKLISKIQTKDSISINSGIKYTPKLLKKLFKNKKVDLAVLIDNIPHKVGTVKNIKIKNKSDDIILETVVKSTIDFNMDNKELKFGCLYNNESDTVEYKDIEKIFFYLIDKKLENMLNDAYDYGLNLTKILDNTKITNARLTLNEYFGNKKNFNDLKDI